jgi:hypothetical protein
LSSDRRSLGFHAIGSATILSTSELSLYSLATLAGCYPLGVAVGVLAVLSLVLTSPVCWARLLVQPGWIDWYGWPRSF